MDDGTIRVLVDGIPGGAIPASDSSVLRGDGVFEVIRCYAGEPYRFDDHLDRMERSAAALELSVPPRGEILRWVKEVAGEAGDCLVRIVLTRGPALPGVEGVGRCVVLSHPVPEPASAIRLWPVPAPWHPGGRPWDLAGVKTISYAPNMAATRAARLAGATDALLLNDGGVVLEGPTFSVGWFRGEHLLTPSLELGILDSITRRAVLELWPDVEEGSYRLAEVTSADEVFAMSTVKEVSPVTAIGQQAIRSGPMTRRLAQRFAASVAQPGASAQPR